MYFNAAHERCLCNAMTTPTSEPTRDEQRNALYESRGWEERSNDHVRMDDLADEIIRLRTALANAEREREAANDRAHNADVIIGNVSTILNAHDRLLTVESAARELVSERDALQRTVAGMREFVEQLASGDFASPFKRDPHEFAKSHIAAISERAKELLTTPTREGSTDA